MNDDLEFINLNKKGLTSKAKVRINRSLIVLSVCAVLFLVVTIIRIVNLNKADTQFAYRKWTSGGKNAAQVSMFFDEDAKVDTVTVGRIKNLLIKAYNSGLGLEYDENDLDNGPFLSCYSTLGSISISSENVEEKTCSCYAVGGDFFNIHSVKMVSGDSLYSSSSEDLVFLDSISAFRMFGSSDVVDMKVFINDKPFYVAGVYEIDDSSMSKKAGSDTGYVYMMYDAYTKIDKDASVTCLEFVGDSPTDDYLRSTIAGLECGIDDENKEIILNSERFGIKKMLNNLKDYPNHVMVKNNIIYPFWENIARGYEAICTVIFAIQIVLLVVMIIALSCIISILIKNADLSEKSFSDFIWNMQDKRRSKKRAKALKPDRKRSKRIKG